MKKLLNLFSAVLVCIVLNQTNAIASSHREAPLIANDPLADNTDVYAFRSPCDTNKVVLIANYIPFEHPAGGPNYYNFGTDVRYEIHVDNDGTKAGDEIIYRFTFKSVNEDSTTFFNIRLKKQNIKTTYTLERSMDAGANFTTIVNGNGMVPPNNIGPRSIENTTVGLGVTYDSLVNAATTTATTGETVFCGPRDDPFFVDLGGAFDVGNFRDTTAARDGLAKFNVHSIVIQVPISTLQRNQKTTAQAVSILDSSFVIGVWANASRQKVSTFDTVSAAYVGSGNWIQVSRLGMPLTNEVINPIGQKDKWNASNPSGDSIYAKYFTNPELGLYMDDSRFGTAVPGLAALRIQTKSLGVYDFRNDSAGLYGVRGSAGVTGTAFAESAQGGFANLLLPNDSSPRAVDLLPIFLTGVPNLPPYQLATGKPDGKPLSPGKPFINNFLPTIGDMLRLNMAVPVTYRSDTSFSSLGIIKAAVLGLTDPKYNTSPALQFIPNMDGFPNGRRLEDDVTTIELQAVSGVALAAIGLWYDDYTVGQTASPVTPQLKRVLGFNAGVTHNDTTLLACFPYLQTPWRGFIGPEYKGTEVLLPIDMVSFVAEKVNQNVQLRWHVSNEVNTDRYEIEQSLNGTAFIKIGSVLSKGGDGTNSYEFTDMNPSRQKNNFYRIRQVDKDGRFTYSVIRLVKFTSQTLITVTPNPASNFIKVYTTQMPLTVHLYDAGGRKMVSQLITDGAGQINISRFNRGTYILVAESNGVRIETKKIVKQ
jgi:hypothetical protein